MTDKAEGEKLAWTVLEWRTAVSLSKPYTHQLINNKIINSVKAGTRRLITTSPQEYLARLSQQKGAYTKRGRPTEPESKPWVLDR